jgi:hypothetical protein
MTSSCTPIDMLCIYIYVHTIYTCIYIHTHTHMCVYISTRSCTCSHTVHHLLYIYIYIHTHYIYAIECVLRRMRSLSHLRAHPAFVGI